ncbi:MULTISPECIES: STAS domain-containing protein [unclassified Agarivorans]|uniref:STAS domain-containing protein n=1 Tax=unclassified Agarivorans TaxID=2636026 RepID=UPI003D7E80E7
MNMQLTTSVQGDITASIVGALDASSCGQYKHVFEDLCQSSANKVIVVNMTQVSQLDASGIGALVFMFKRIHAAGGHLIICGAQQQPRDLLLMLRVNQIITMFDTLPSSASVHQSLSSIAA